MSTTTSTRPGAKAKKATTSGRLFFLDLAAGRVLSANPDGSDLKVIVNEGRKLPDGLVIAAESVWVRNGRRSVRLDGGKVCDPLGSDLPIMYEDVKTPQNIFSLDSGLNVFT